MENQLLQLVHDIIECIQTTDSINREQILHENPHVSSDELALLSKQQAERLEELRLNFFIHHLPNHLYELNIDGTDITPDDIKTVARVIQDTRCCPEGILISHSIEAHQMRTQSPSDFGFVVSRSKLQQLIEQSVQDVIEAYVKEVAPGGKVSALSIA